MAAPAKFLFDTDFSAPDRRERPSTPAEVAQKVAEAWVSVFERQQTPGTELVFRCDVPVPWIGDGELVYAAPQAVGIFEARAEGGLDGAADEADAERDQPCP